MWNALNEKVPKGAFCENIVITYEASEYKLNNIGAFSDKYYCTWLLQKRKEKIIILCTIG